MIEPDAPSPIVFPPAPSTTDAAPMLPIEGPIVTAALKVSEAKLAVEWLLFAIEHHPRDRESVDATFRRSADALRAAADAYMNYTQIFDCRGQG